MLYNLDWAHLERSCMHFIHVPALVWMRRIEGRNHLQFTFLQHLLHEPCVWNTTLVLGCSCFHGGWLFVGFQAHPVVSPEALLILH